MTCLLSDETGDEINEIKNLATEHTESAENTNQKDFNGTQMNTD
jgi:hypothetical protein